MKVVILIDYDNLLDTQKVSGILDTVHKALIKLPKDIPIFDGSCNVRIYGGWFEENIMTKLAQNLSVEIQNDFPKIVPIQIDKGLLKLKVNAELAMALAEEPAHQLFNTFRKKGKPRNIRISTPQEVGCTNSGCTLPLASKLLKKGKCPTVGCTITSPDLLYRHEQKLVDTMLTCDLLYYSIQRYEYIMLISEDDDFIPPIRTLMIHGSKIFRISPNPNNQRALSPILGTHLFESVL